MVSKHSELVKRQVQDRYGRFASPSSRIAPPPSHHEVGSFSHRRTAPPPSRQEEASSNDLVEMWGWLLLLLYTYRWLLLFL
jgi:hypothetical protein